VRSSVDLPGFDYSAMDGYAVATRDLRGSGPFTLLVQGEARTGAVPAAMTPGTACRIFTGAEIPWGADAVVMQESVSRQGDAITFADRPAPLLHVRRRGSDLTAGDVAIARGTRLRPAHLALGAAIDRTFLQVARRPSITILGTGDELRSPGTPAMPGTIPESNSVALAAMAHAAGADARVGPYVKDDPKATREALEAGLVATDVLVTVGGVSVGDHDLVRPALEAIGVTIEFWKVAIKPGKPLAVGRRGPQLVLGIPGNPASAMVTFALFGLPLLRAMQGDLRPFPAPLRARLARDVPHQPGRRAFLRAALSGRAVTPISNQASGAAVSMTQADGLLAVPADSTGLSVGDEVDIYPFESLGV
jgi:molybdopterin molybdotransferase